MSSDEACAVCGRTILFGERTLGYLDPEGRRRGVCELCRERAERLGWVWEELAGHQSEAPRKRRRGGFGALFRRRSAYRPAGEDLEEEGEPAEPAQASPDPAAPGSGVGRAHTESGEAAGLRLERAVARFNESEASRTVAGLMRSLGPAWVSIGAAAGSPGEVRITVAWELCWYQWGVDVRDEMRPVFQLDKGTELGQLDHAARQWNASALPGGQIALDGPATERARYEGARYGIPVHHDG